MFNQRLICFLICFSLMFAGISLTAQEKDLFPGSSYNPDVPTPSAVLGHRLGERHTFNWEMENYLRALEKASDRILVRSYGKTYQGRKLYTVFMSSPGNLERLEEIRTANLSLTDPRKLSGSALDEIVSWMPAVVWLGYNIHGNEGSAMEAAVRTLYQLAAGTDERTLEILNKVVCIIDPCQNPDGHDRFVHSVRSVATIASHPQPEDTEHASSWPGGRSNHYLFDLNRDFFLKTQIESLEKARAYHLWMPHVFADLHEMGSSHTYFFSPPMTPYNHYVKPVLRKWWDIIARANASAFDHFNWGYYTRESFDAFYPGYGTSYPSINGAVGMTYEQASARGLSIIRADGTVLTLREAAWHHFITSMATLQVTAERREEKIRDFHEFFQIALREAASDPMKEIVITPRNDPGIAARLVENLLIEGVEVLQAAEGFENPRATSYLTKKRDRISFPKGTYIIRLNQPQYILIKALMAPDSPLGEDFIEEEKARKSSGESSHFYDVTAWSLPLTYGVDAYWTEVDSGPRVEPLSKTPVVPGGMKNGRAHQVYLIPFETMNASRLLIRLMAEDFRVRMARKSFTLDGETWPRGTLVVRVNRNSEKLHERLTALAGEFGIKVTSVHSGLVEKGIDLGSYNVAALKKPRIALLTGEATSSSSYGAIHYLFERRFGLSFFTRVDPMGSFDLNHYDVIVFPSGRYGRAFSKARLEELRGWLRKGGTLVAVAGAADWLRGVSLSKVKLLKGIPDPTDERRTLQPEPTPGAIVRVRLDQRSPLCFGVPPMVAVQVRSRRICQAFQGPDRRNVGVYDPDGDLRLSGFIWPDTAKMLPGGGWLFVEPFGRGQVIQFTEDPNFRASYYGLDKLFLNAILLGPSFGGGRN